MLKISNNDIQLTITETALKQWELIKEHDFTLIDKQLRLKVDGKGCHGFDYAIGFDQALQDDLTFDIQYNNKNLQLIIDSFTAFYAKEGTLDYIVDFENDTEGFQFTNANEKNYRGKFFKNEALLPK